jgi:hypothetical protein
VDQAVHRWSEWPRDADGSNCKQDAR